ncbi:hypothetical protein Tco_0748020 [Tanacetum coccineum]|uniref:Uncharacterized protein n=1 Tax=Tanacetum coccineum TaxID=301880 RepID=A0ABQ4YUI4_9ASTR
MIDGTAGNRLLRMARPQHRHVRAGIINSSSQCHEAETVNKGRCNGRIQKNLLDRVSQLHWPFSLPKRLKADNTIIFASVLDSCTTCVLDDEQKVYMELCPNEILIDLDGPRLYKRTFVI